MNDNEKDKKLDWMYKGATSLVDREEYLLGRTVDKSLEQLNQEEKEKKLGIVPPKNHVEHECIPPSIRDYNKMVQAEQVDLSAKLQEDPLVAIRKREEEARRLFLQNPIQLKKLQEALKAQECKKIERKQGRHLKKLKESDSDSDLDRKIASKLKYLKSDSADINILKKPKKKNDDSLDIVLMHKYNQLKDKLSQKDLNDILEGRVSSSSENSTGSESDNSESIKKERNPKQDKKRKRRTNSSQRETETIIENKKRGREKRSLKTKNKETRDSSIDDSDSGDDRGKNHRDKMKKDKYWKKEKRGSSSPEDEKTRKNTKVNKNNKKRSFSSSENEEKNRNWQNRSKEKVDDRKKRKVLSYTDRKRTYSGSSAEEDKKRDVNSDNRVDILTKAAANKKKSKEKVKIKNKRRHKNCSDSTDSSDEEYITKGKDRYDNMNESENYSRYKYSEKKRKNISDDNGSDNKNRRKQDDSSNDEYSKHRYERRKSSNRRRKSESSTEEERKKESSYKRSSTKDSKQVKMTRHERNSKIRCRSSSESEKLIKTNEKGRSSDVDSNNSENVDNSLDQLILQKLRMLRDSKPVKPSEQKDSLSSKNEGIYSHYDSDDDKHTYKVKLFGLVKSDGTKIPLNISSREEKKAPEVKKIEPLKLPERKTVKKLTEKEKEKLRQQMMKDAVTRDKERSDNLRKYREDDRREEIERTTKEFDKTFLHKELLKGTSSASVESRIKSKLNNIQRSSRDMATNFSKRN